MRGTGVPLFGKKNQDISWCSSIFFLYFQHFNIHNSPEKIRTTSISLIIEKKTIIPENLTYKFKLMYAMLYGSSSTLDVYSLISMPTSIFCFLRLVLLTSWIIQAHFPRKIQIQADFQNYCRHVC